MPAAPSRATLLGLVLPLSTALGASAFTHDEEANAIPDAPLAPEVTATSQENDTQRVDFMRDVRPILAQHCFACHGPDEATRAADLRLDLRGLALNPDDPFAPIVAGDPDNSPAIVRVFDDADPMPPVAHDDPLTAEQKQVLRQWVEEGATWPEHWAFVAPTSHAAPNAAGSERADWVRDPLDGFVLAELEQNDLEPSDEATREAWLRRVTFDLTGLPPTLEELDAFLADTSESAFENQVDRLLRSPRYGERMATDWLDLARYADTSGFQFDTSRTMWKWRDWVIDAFNENQPYDDFIVEQLAGDLLPDPSVAQLVATGFNRNHPTDSDSPAEHDEFRTQYVLDRVHTTATAFLGLTMSCAQCHDHKYDPVSQEDFYSFYAFFNSVAERDIDFGSPRPRLHVPTPDQEPHYESLQRSIALLEARLEADDPLLDASQDVWEEQVLARLGAPIAWETLEPVGMLSHNGAHLRLQPDGSVLAQGPTPVTDVYDLVLAPGTRTVHALRIEVLPTDDDAGASGRDAKGMFTLSSLELRTTNVNSGEDAEAVYVATAQADLVQERDAGAPDDAPQPGGLDGVVVYPSADDGDGDSGFGGFGFGGGGGWSLVGPATRESREIVLVPIAPLELNEASVIKLTLEQDGRTRGTLARFRVSVTDESRAREQLLPFAPQHWSTLGPFPAADLASAYTTEFAPEADFEDGIQPLKKYDQPRVETLETEGKPTSKAPGKAPVESDGEGKGEARTKPAPQPIENAEPSIDFERVGLVLSEGQELPFVVALEARDRLDTSPFEAAPSDTADQIRFERPIDVGAADEEARESTDADTREVGVRDDAATDPAEESEEAEPERPRRRPRRLSWNERDTWVDGRSQELDGGTVAWYLARTVETTRARTVVLRLDGPLGVRVWLNGEEVFEEAPKARASGPERDGESGGPFGGGFDGGDFDDENFDFEAFFSGRGGDDDTGDRTVRLGMRAGTNEVIVKAVFEAPPEREGRGGESRGGQQFGGQNFGGMGFGGMGFGGRGRTPQVPAVSITFDMTPEGDDLITHEIITALRERGPGGDLARSDAEGAKTSVLPEDETAWNEHIDGPLAPRKVAPATGGVATATQLEKNLRRYYRAKVSTIGRALVTEKKRLETEFAELTSDMPQTMVMADRDEPRPTHIFMRGDYRKPGREVSARVPTVLPPLPESAPKNRLGLARWIASPDNPLTARVAVNRAWQLHFGSGLVSTPEDFGIRGALPSHPELLDTLASDFVASGWDRKALHRRIVLSATYRQSSRVDAERLERDPENRLLARGPRVRLSAEMVRDNALFVAGLLNEEVGGPSIKPYQAPGLWREFSGGGRYRQTEGDAQYRRGLYVFWKRRAPYASMVTFDAAKGETCTVERPSTNTPLQALVLLNNPVYVEASKMFGQRLLEAEGLTDAERLAQGFRLCTSREPTEAEAEILMALLVEQRAIYAGDEEASKKLLAVGDAEVSAELDACELAAWTAVSNALLNLDATINKG